MWQCGEFVKPYPLADAKSKKRRVLGGLLDKIKHETSLTGAAAVARLLE